MVKLYESSLGGHAILLGLSWGGSYVLYDSYLDYTMHYFFTVLSHYMLYICVMYIVDSDWIIFTPPPRPPHTYEIIIVICLLFHVLSILLSSFLSSNEPRHNKTNKMSVRPAKTQISLGIRPVWSESSQCAQWLAENPRFLHADSEDWSDWADAQADLSLRWTPSHFVGFVMSRLICVVTPEWNRVYVLFCSVAVKLVLLQPIQISLKFFFSNTLMIFVK